MTGSPPQSYSTRGHLLRYGGRFIEYHDSTEQELRLRKSRQILQGENRMMRRAATSLALFFFGAGVLFASSEKETGIDWITDWERAVQLAKKQHKLLVLDLYTNWCTWCRVMDVHTYGDPSVIEALGPEYVWLRLNAETEEDGREAQRRFRVSSYPATLLIEPEEGLYEKTSGFLSAEKFGEAIKRHRLSLQSIIQLRDRVRTEPDSVESKLELAARYMERRHYRGAEQLYRALVEVDSGSELDQSYFSLAVSLAQQGKERQALEPLADLQKRFPGSDLLPHALAIQGEIHLNLGNRGEAIKFWREFLSRFPSHPMAERITGELKRIESVQE